MIKQKATGLLGVPDDSAIRGGSAVGEGLSTGIPLRPLGQLQDWENTLSYPLPVYSVHSL